MTSWWRHGVNFVKQNVLLWIYLLHFIINKIVILILAGHLSITFDLFKNDLSLLTGQFWLVIFRFDPLVIFSSFKKRSRIHNSSFNQPELWTKNRSGRNIFLFSWEVSRVYVKNIKNVIRMEKLFQLILVVSIVTFCKFYLPFLPSWPDLTPTWPWLDPNLTKT